MNRLSGCPPIDGRGVLMSTVRFDGQRLREVLTTLTLSGRIAFAASCVEVLVASYVRYSELEQVGDANLVRASVDAVWSALEGREPEVIHSDLPSPESVKELLPSADEWNEWAPQAEDAIASLVYLLELLGADDASYAAYTAERAYAAVDEFAAREQGLEVLDADDREALRESPLVQAELRRQAEALRLLQESTVERSAVTELRTAARRLSVGGAL
ncbi:DUF416 family protein [Micromonospora sp. WMMD961]|uniref:DUF416 family protein n=1 Tax=Micromonospora sp. WMMD961 TaxID=3016100 RepID=UPI002415ABE1|nr:DUF416 family protein [Micromonospora sp. WMMD961]MDG4784175.1 DUF416 family protein [Micromonospora sp. WMMD961]